MKKNSLLQKVDDDPANASSFSPGKIIFYLAVLALAFYFGQRLMSPSEPAVKAEPAPVATAAPVPTVANVAPAAKPSKLATAPVVSNIVSAPALRTSAPVSAPPSVASAPIPMPESVIITQPVEVPMKHGGKVVGYINLQPGQQIKPFSMDDKQAMIRFGENVGSLPLSATSLKH